MTEVTHLLLRAAGGDVDAFEQVVRSSQGELQRFFSATAQRADAPDLTQETFVRAWKSLASFEGRSSGRSWLFGVARNVLADHVRRTSRRRSLRSFLSLDGVLSEANEPVAFMSSRTRAEATGGQAEEEHALLDLIAALPLERREAFVFTQLLGFSYEETAHATNVAIGTVRSRVARAREQLISALNEVDSETRGAFSATKAGARGLRNESDLRSDESEGRTA